MQLGAEQKPVKLANPAVRGHRAGKRTHVTAVLHNYEHSTRKRCSSVSLQDLSRSE